MKIVVQVRLLPDAGQAAALASVLRAVNDAANLVSAVAFDRRCSASTRCASSSTAT